MGAGLYFPQSVRDDQFRCVYAEPYADLDEDSDTLQDDVAALYEDFKDDLADCLPKSFERLTSRRWIGRDELVFAENGLFVVTLYEDDYNRVHVALQVHPDIVQMEHLSDVRREQLARNKLGQTADFIFDRLHKIYPCRVRTSAWTSGPYEPSTEYKALAA